MAIKEIQIKKLVLLDKNPRKIKKESLQKLVASIKRDPDFLKQRPILVNLKDGVHYIYGGNQRVKAAKKLKWLKIPCAVSENLSDERMRERIIKDNQTYGEFDYDVLRNDWDIAVLIAAGVDKTQLSTLIDDLPNTEILFPDMDKEIFSMSFTLSKDQKDSVDQAVIISKKMGPFLEDKNKNSNGNALARIVEWYVSKSGLQG